MQASEQRTQFDYLLNAMENAAREAHPAKAGYAGKRKAVFAYVRDLEKRALSDSKAREIPAELFDGYSVYSALTDRQKAFVSPEAVSAVLDAAVRMIRASRALKELESTKP